ncbi:actophorin-like [Symsagittifera roscoffensis]|uniref:actophorin-like n=1 Tax=Symsagittifera roscoffensis TaxID=84072 RepID=UPI00307B29D2
MVNSGIKNSPQCKKVFEQLQKEHKWRYIVYKINMTSLLIDPIIFGDKDASYQQFLDDLNKSGCCYAVYDFVFHKPDGSKREKIVFINWAPDDQPMKAKMYQSSTMTEMEKAVDGYYLKMQASDIGDIAEKDVAEQLNKMVK